MSLPLEVAEVVLADLIRAPGSEIFYLDSKNKVCGTAASLLAARRSRRCFMVKLGPDYVGVDVDDLSQLEPALRIVRASGYPYFRTRSGGPAGNRHIVIRTGREARGRLVDELELVVGGQVRVDNYLRPPGSPHKSGIGRSTLDSVDLAAEFLRACGTTRTDLHSRLDESVLSKLDRVGGLPKGQRSGPEMSLLWDLAKAGFTDGEIFAMAWWRFPKPHDGSVRQGLGYLLTSVNNMRIEFERLELDGGHRASALRARLRILRAMVDTYPYGAYGIKNTRKVLAACLAVFERLGSTRVDLARLSIAEAAGITKGTTKKHMDLLQDKGILIMVRRGDRGVASRYELNLSRLEQLLGIDPYMYQRGCELYWSDLAKPDHPAFMHGFLNESGRSVLNTFGHSGDELRRRDILERLSDPLGAVDTALRTLVSGGLLEKPAGSWGVYRRTDLSLDEYAGFYGADQVAKRRKAANVRQRVNYGRHLLERLAEQSGQHWILSTYEPLSSWQFVDVSTGEVTALAFLSESLMRPSSVIGLRTDGYPQRK